MYHKQLPYAYISGDFNRFITSFENHYLDVNGYLRKPILVLVAGPSCSGKTFFTNKLRQYWKDQTGTICMDDYFRDDGDPILETCYAKYDGKYGYFDMPESYCLAELECDLRRLLSGQDIWAPVYGINQNLRTEWKRPIMAGKQFYIVEGLYAFWLDEAKIYDAPAEDHVVRVFADARYETRLKRRLERDSGKFPGVTDEKIEWVFTHKTETAFRDFDNHKNVTVDFYLDTD